MSTNITTEFDCHPMILEKLELTLSPINRALLNSVILTKIFEHSSRKDAKNQRLVCTTWNSVILSLPSPKFNLVINKYKTGGCCNAKIFQDFSIKMNPKLARWISVMVPTEKYCSCPSAEDGNNGNSFQSWFENYEFRNNIGLTNLRFCGQNYEEQVQFMTLIFDVMNTPSFYLVLQDHFANIKSLSVFGLCSESEDNFPSSQLQAPLMGPLPTKFKLGNISFKCRQYSLTNQLHTMLQHVVTASPNLKKLDLQIHHFPDLSRNPKLEYFAYCTVVQPNQMGNFSLIDLSNLLMQISAGLKHLKLNLYHSRRSLEWFPDTDLGFVMPKMSQLITFRTNFIHIFSCGDAMEAVVGDNLKILKFSKGLGKAGDVQDLLENMAKYEPYLNNAFESLQHLVLEGVTNTNVLIKLWEIFPSLKRVKLSSTNRTHFHFLPWYKRRR